MTHPSKSKTRSVAAIGNGCVIPAKAGIHFDLQGPMDSRLRGNDGGESGNDGGESGMDGGESGMDGGESGMDGGESGMDGGESDAFSHPSKSKTRSVAAIGNGCVIPAKAGIHFDLQGPMDSRLRGNDGGESGNDGGESGMDGGETDALSHPSTNKTRSVASIGNGCVIPANAGIHFDLQGPMDFRFRGNDGGPAFAGMTTEA